MMKSEELLKFLEDLVYIQGGKQIARSIERKRKIKNIFNELNDI